MTPEDRTELPRPPDMQAPDRANRRRLLRSGLATAPALLTLVNRPVMAAACKTPSAAISASLSRPDSGLFQCTGKSPASWSGTSAANWPSPSGTQTELFSAAIGASPTYGTKTLLEMVNLVNNMGAEGLAKYLVAGYLNALQNLTPNQVLSVPTIRKIWLDFSALGYYEPTAGIRWFPNSALPIGNPPSGGLIAWLQTTMPN